MRTYNSVPKANAINLFTVRLTRSKVYLNWIMGQLTDPRLSQQNASFSVFALRDCIIFSDVDFRAI